MDFTLTKSEKIIKFIELNCRIPEGKNVGEHVKLEDWQKKFIRETYSGNVRRAYLSIARKNGKTTLIAFLVLAHIIGPVKIRNSQIVSGAQSESQASLLYDTCVKIIRMNPVLERLCVIRQSPKKIVGNKFNTEYKPLAAKASTAYGISPAVAILDEIGQVKGEQDEFVSVIETSQGAYDNPLLIAISTQAATDSDLFSIWMDYAKDKKDETIVCHSYASDQDCDILDEKQWYKANPGLGTIRNYDDLKNLANRTYQTGVGESEFRNLFLNQRVERLDPYVTQSVWQSNGESVTDRDDIIWYAGLDLSATQDLTAYVRVGWQKNANGKDQLHCIPRFFLPAKNIADKERTDREPYRKWNREGYLELIPGPVVDYKSIAKIIIDDIDSGKVSKIAFDRWGMGLFYADLYEIGGTKTHSARFEPFGQGYQSMSPALRKLDEVMYNQKLRHANNPVLTMCAKNSIVQSDPAGNRKLTKANRNRRIDGMVALVMAVFISGNPVTTTKSIYDDKEFLEVLTY